MHPLGIVAALAVGGCALLIGSAYRRWSARDTRTAAANLGLKIREVLREVPVSGDRGRTWRLERGRCVEYRVDRDQPTMCVWRLLMRAGERNPGLEPGWRLDIDGQPSRDLREALEIIMREEAFHGEFLEFEGSKDAVAVYWEEWGGLPMAERLNGYLRRLALIA